MKPQESSTIILSQDDSMLVNCKKGNTLTGSQASQASEILFLRVRGKTKHNCGVTLKMTTHKRIQILCYQMESLLQSSAGMPVYEASKGKRKLGGFEYIRQKRKLPQITSDDSTCSFSKKTALSSEGKDNVFFKIWLNTWCQMYSSKINLLMNLMPK